MTEEDKDFLLNYLSLCLQVPKALLKKTHLWKSLEEGEGK